MTLDPKIEVTAAQPEDEWPFEAKLNDTETGELTAVARAKTWEDFVDLHDAIVGVVAQLRLTPLTVSPTQIALTSDTEL